MAREIEWLHRYVRGIAWRSYDKDHGQRKTIENHNDDKNIDKFENYDHKNNQYIILFTLKIMGMGIHNRKTKIFTIFYYMIGGFIIW